jgi:hypothetical protein
MDLKGCPNMEVEEMHFLSVGTSKEVRLGTDSERNIIYSLDCCQIHF